MSQEPRKKASPLFNSISLTQTMPNTDMNLESFIGQYVFVGSTRCRREGLRVRGEGWRVGGVSWKGRGQRGEVRDERMGVEG